MKPLTTLRHLVRNAQEQRQQRQTANAEAIATEALTISLHTDNEYWLTCNGVRIVKTSDLNNNARPLDILQQARENYITTHASTLHI